ncbi:hypothetical protein JHK87_017514 [Glycine soja]|nr:hypothetical protein JHK87_017514 [Glycine soja]
MIGAMMCAPSLEAGGAANVGEEEVERVHEEGEEARNKEHPVPIGHDVAVGVQDLVGMLVNFLRINGHQVFDYDPKSKQEMEEESFTYAMQLVNSNVLSMAMYSAIELGIFDIIAKAGEAAKLSAKDIAAQLPCKNSEAATMLDISLYGMNAVAKYFASIDDGAGSLGPFMMLAQDKAALQTWSVFPFLYSTLLSGE